MRSVAITLAFVFFTFLSAEAKPLDLVVSGTGYLTVSNFSGDLLFVKNGSFSTNAYGDLVFARSQFPLMGYRIDTLGIMNSELISVNLMGIKNFQLSENGILSGEVFHDGRYCVQELYRIPLASFTDVNSLSSVGDGMFQANAYSGEATITPISSSNTVGLIFKGVVIEPQGTLKLSVSEGGYLVLMSESGERLYANSVNLKINANYDTLKNKLNYSLMTNPISPEGIMSSSFASVRLMTMTRYILKQDGTLLRFYDWSEIVPMAKIPLAYFNGEDFLSELEDGVFQENPSSGSAIVSTAGHFGRQSEILAHQN